MKKVAGTLRLDLNQFQELQSFAQFGSDLDKATQDTLARGERLRAILKQDERSPQPVEEQVAVIYAATNGYLDGIEVDNVPDYEEQFLDYLRDSHSEILRSIRDEQQISDETDGELREALAHFNESYEPRGTETIANVAAGELSPGEEGG